MITPRNYKGPTDCAATWGTFRADKSGGATQGTIDHLSRAGGYTGPSDRTEAEVYTETIANIEHVDVNSSIHSENSQQLLVFPKPYIFKNPQELPRRDWLYGQVYMRGVISAT
jgi:hypothetical protein